MASPETTILLRPAQPSDIAACMAIDAELFEDPDSRWEWESALFERGARFYEACGFTNSCGLIAEEIVPPKSLIDKIFFPSTYAKMVVGALVFNPYNESLDVEFIGVLPSLQRHGVACAMLGLLETLAKQWAIPCVTAMVPERNEAGIRLFRHRGWRGCGVAVGAFPEDRDVLEEDGILFKKILL